jgi:hypothetical protein
LSNKDVQKPTLETGVKQLTQRITYDEIFCYSCKRVAEVVKTFERLLRPEVQRHPQRNLTCSLSSNDQERPLGNGAQMTKERLKTFNSGV